jgi:hypothetical protein
VHKSCHLKDCACATAEQCALEATAQYGDAEEDTAVEVVAVGRGKRTSKVAARIVAVGTRS